MKESENDYKSKLFLLVELVHSWIQCKPKRAGLGCLLAEIVILNDSSRKDMSVIVIYSQDDVENLQTCENK